MKDRRQKTEDGGRKADIEVHRVRMVSKQFHVIITCNIVKSVRSLIKGHIVF